MRLRIKDIDFDYNQLLVRAGKGDKDRVTVLPESLCEPLREQVKLAHRYYEFDRQEACPGVELRHALERKYPNAGKEWSWFWVFPAKNRSTDPRTGVVRRHRVYAKTLAAPTSGPHTALAHPCARGIGTSTYGTGTAGHKYLNTTMIYTHVLQRGGRGTKSPLDQIE